MIALESRTATEHQVETIVKKCKSVSFSYFQLYNSISILNDPAVQQFIDFELDEDKCRCLADEQMFSSFHIILTLLNIILFVNNFV